MNAPTCDLGPCLDHLDGPPSPAHTCGNPSLCTWTRRRHPEGDYLRELRSCPAGDALDADDWPRLHDVGQWAHAPARLGRLWALASKRRQNRGDRRSEGRVPTPAAFAGADRCDPPAPRPVPAKALPWSILRCCRAAIGDDRSAGDLRRRAAESLAEAEQLEAAASAAAARGDVPEQSIGAARRRAWDARYRAGRSLEIIAERRPRWDAAVAAWRAGGPSAEGIRAMLGLLDREHDQRRPMARQYGTPRPGEREAHDAALAAWRAEGAPLRAALRLAGGPRSLAGAADTGGPATAKALRLRGITSHSLALTAAGAALAREIRDGLALLAGLAGLGEP